ncbi:MAG TPA: thioredoxin-like domain-containing protein [Micavibrio sp.]|jgi:thiol-disulfide isomerase/thioredoxin
MTRLALLFIFCLLSMAPAAQADLKGFDRLAAGGVGGWLNVTRPLTAEDMKGRLILLDFWTYGCVNCMQVVPDLTYLEEKFGDRLLIIGVHSAKFSGEQGNDRILAAAQRFGLKHPVVNDADYAIWKSFHVRAWPTLVLLDGQGDEIVRYEGEGHRADLDAAIAKALPAAAPAAASVSGLIAKDNNASILSFPARLASDGKLIYVADSGHNRILGFDHEGIVKAIIGSGSPGLKDGGFAMAQFALPRGIALADNVLYVADTNNHAIRKVDLAARTVETIAGNGVQGEIASPWDIETMGDGRTLAIAMAGHHQIDALDMKTGALSVLAGSGREDIIDGPAARAALAQPSGLSKEGDTLFFVDAESSALRTFKDGRITTLIGAGLFDFGLRDGRYPEAMLQHPQGLFADKTRIIIADTYNDALRLYDRKTGILSTIKLTGNPLHEPGDILVAGDQAYIADTDNHAIRRVDLKTGVMENLELSEKK